MTSALRIENHARLKQDTPNEPLNPVCHFCGVIANDVILRNEQLPKASYATMSGHYEFIETQTYKALFILYRICTYFNLMWVLTTTQKKGKRESSCPLYTLRVVPETLSFMPFHMFARFVVCRQIPSRQDRESPHRRTADHMQQGF